MDRPALYLPFRVFSQSAELVATAQDRHFYLDQECAAVQGSTGIVALSFYDKRRLELLQELCSQSLRPGGFPLETCALAGSESSDHCEAKAGQSHKHQHSNIAVLWPPVRSDILSIGRSLMQQSLRVSGWAKWNWQENRRFITCCVRLSREKVVLACLLGIEINFENSTGDLCKATLCFNIKAQHAHSLIALLCFSCPAW